MKAAKPVEIDNKAHQNQNKRQRPKDPVVPLHEVDVANVQTQKSVDSIIKSGNAVPDSRLGLNGTIAAVHGSQTIYDQGSEVMYGKLQNSLKETGDINHPDTKNTEKDYMKTLNLDQVKDYHDLKSGNYQPKTVQEQAAAAQNESISPETTEKPEIQPVQDPVAASDAGAELIFPAEQEDAPVKTVPADAKSDPQFNETIGLVKNTAKAKRAHTTKDKAETEANAAAAIPAGERKSKARGQQVEKLDQQKTKPFSTADFKKKLSERIKNMKLPKNEKQVEDFENNNNIDQVNQLATADVVASKKNVTGSIETVAKQEPNESAIQQRTAKALPDPKIGSKVNIKAIVPGKRGDAEVSEPITKKYKEVEDQLEKNNITDEQLANSNEPSFINALNAKKAAKENAENAPAEFKAAESKKLESSKHEAQGKANSTMDGMHNSRKEMLNGVTKNQQKAGEKNTGKHQEVVAQLNQIYADTKKSVDAELDDLETKVTQLFDAGAKVAKAAFERHVSKKTEEYKKKRYGSWYDVTKYGKRIKDAWNGLPKEVEVFFAEGRELFLEKLEVTINIIANLVTTRLNRAKAAITTGRQKVTTFIKNLPADVKKAVKGDIDAIQGKFKELEKSISDKESSLIDALAKKYNEALKDVDELANEMRKKNQGLLSALKEATLGVWETIKNIKKTLTDLLAGAIEIIISIITHPIDFLSNLIDGVSQGFSNFGANIWTHLKTGFFTWLTGATKGISITMPEDIFSLKGIFSISMQILGLDWKNIRAIGAKEIGEPVMRTLETGFEMVQIVRKDGVAGLWEHLKDQFADLKQTVMDTIMDIIQTQVIQAGIKWIMGLLTPVGAFIKAAMAIIDVVKFFIQRAAQIMELVRAFMESIKAVASGNVSAVAKSIENALGKAIPVLIGFLAALLGISGLADKVKNVIEKIRGRIEKTIARFWNFVKNKAKGFLSKVGSKKGVKTRENVDNITDGKEKLFTKLRNDEQEINVDGGHKLRFENEGELAVYSTRIGLNELLRQKQEEISANKTANDYSKKQMALNKLNTDKKSFGQELSKYKGKQDRKYSANVKEEYNAIKGILKSMAASLEIIGVYSLETTSLLPTKVTYVTQGKKAKQVIAQPLTKIPGNTHGSSPGSSVPVGWEQIDPDQRSDFWVRAHLLNHHLHGPGVNWNLFPAHKDINKGMELAVENPAKKAVAGKDNKSYFYETNLTYGAGDFPTHIKVEFGEYDAKTGQRQKVSDGYDQPLRIPEPYTVNINTASAARLQQVAKANDFKGMTVFFKDLVNERNKNGVFGTVANIRKRMSEIGKDSHIENLILLIRSQKLRII